MDDLKRIINGNESIIDYLYQQVTILEAKESTDKYKELERVIRERLGLSEQQQEQLLQLIDDYDISREKDGFRTGLQVGVAFAKEIL